MNHIVTIAIAVVVALAMMIPSAFALDSEFNVYIVDYDVNHNYRTCMAEAGSLPLPDDCVIHTGHQLETGEIPSFIAVDAQPGLRLVFSVEDTTAKTIIYDNIDDTEVDPQELVYSMNHTKPGTTQFAQEDVQTETQP